MVGRKRKLRRVAFSLILSMLIIFYISIIQKNKYNLLNDLSPTARTFIEYKETSGKILSITEVRHFITKYNQEETILNLDNSEHLKEDTAVIVVQVHKYTDAFKYLLASLSEVSGIHETLLIFSHSYIDDNVNKLIQSIDFCPVLQIFYPNSLQAYPNDFSRYYDNESQYGKEIKNDKILNSKGAFNPDIHARYRQPDRAENKHFWWWTASKVFQNVSLLERHTGVVVFLDDDLYLMEDFLYMIYYMRDVAKTLARCEIVSISTEPSGMYDDIYHVEVSTWDARHLSSVIAFDASVWKTIVAHYDEFCSVDDSSWYKSLLSLRGLRGNRSFNVVHNALARAVKISCSGWFCNVLDNAIQVLSVQKKIEKDLFPPFLEVYTLIEMDSEKDRQLGLDIAEGSWFLDVI